MEPFLLLTLAIVVSGYTCQKYSCAGKQLEINQQCAQRKDNVIMISSCGRTTINNHEKFEGDKVREMFCYKPADVGQESYCTVHDFIQYLFPGEHCNITRVCDDSMTKCDDKHSCMDRARCDKESKLCRGRGMRDFCNDNKECNEEMYCEDRGICIAAIEPGEKCEVGEKCRSNSFCYNGICTVFGAYEVGEPAKVVAACSTYYIHGDKCAIGPKRKGDHTCPESGSCSYTIGGESFKQPCVCAKDEQGGKFCPPGLGDIDISPVILYLIELASRVYEHERTSSLSSG